MVVAGIFAALAVSRGTGDALPGWADDVHLSLCMAKVANTNLIKYPVAHRPRLWAAESSPLLEYLPGQAPVRQCTNELDED